MNRINLSLLLIVCVAFSSCFKKEKKSVEIKKDSPEIQKIAYAVGAQYGKSLSSLNFDKKTSEFILAGLRDYQNDKLKLTNNDIQYLAKKVDAIIAKNRSEMAQTQKDKGEAIVTDLLNSTDQSYQKSASGLIYKVIKAGKNVSVKSSNPYISMHFETYHLDGKQIESTKAGNPRAMPLKGVFKAWIEAFSIAGVGGEIEIISPPDLTYGDNGAKPYIEPGEYLKFNLKFVKYYKSQPKK